MKLSTIEARQKPGAIHHVCRKPTIYVYAGVHWCENCEVQVAYCMNCGKAVEEIEDDDGEFYFPSDCEKCSKKLKQASSV